MQAVKRRAPKDGYDNEKKMKYRHEVWSRLSEKARPILDKNENAKVLMLPSKEGLEIDVAMEYGIKPEQIICIDENPALLAHAQWKHKIQKENRYGVKVSRIGEIIKEKGWVLVAANLDFCNNFSDELINETNSLLDNDSIHNNFTFSVTMARGRESKALLSLVKYLEMPEIFYHKRLSAFWHMIEVFKKKHWEMLLENKYTSNRHSMIYAIFHHPNGPSKFKEYLREAIIVSGHLKRIDRLRTGRHGERHSRMCNVRGHYLSKTQKIGIKHRDYIENFVDNHSFIYPKDYIEGFMKTIKHKMNMGFLLDYYDFTGIDFY